MIMEKNEQLREELAYFMRRLYAQGLTTTSGGNLSIRCDSDSIFITPSASDKGRMKGCEIGRMDMNGEIMGEQFKPSIESRMHLEIFKARPDVNAIVHAHPTYASAFSASTAKINNRLLSESYAILGEIAYTGYHRMGSDNLASSVGEGIKKSDCLIMKNHGALAIGKTLLQAFDRLEVLERAAETTLVHMNSFKGISIELNDAELTGLDELMGRKQIS
jgi:L-fuculose-phosphate aldolase